MTSLLAISFWNDVPVGLSVIKIYQGLAILFKTKAKNLMTYKALHSKNCLRFLTYIHTDQNPDFFFFLPPPSATLSLSSFWPQWLLPSSTHIRMEILQRRNVGFFLFLLFCLPLKHFLASSGLLINCSMSWWKTILVTILYSTLY